MYTVLCCHVEILTLVNQDMAFQILMETLCLLRTK